MATWRCGISLLVWKKYFTCSLCSLVKYFSTLKEKFCISMQPCNILFFYSNDSIKIYLLPPLKQFETTTNQEILKAFVMSQGVLFSCVKSHPRFSNFLLRSVHFFLSKVSSSSHGSPVFCHPYLKLKRVDMKKSLAMKGYVPFVTATKLKMKIISY